MGTRLFGWYPSGNGIKTLNIAPSSTTDIGVVRISTNTIDNNIGAMMCAMYVISGSDATGGFTWVPMKWDWLK